MRHRHERPLADLGHNKRRCGAAPRKLPFIQLAAIGTGLKVR